MHIITFYSYKGGVGRTMAAVNVATELARTGARVLLVDFDLEAPSLMTFNLAGTNRPFKGLVDYVLDYLEHGVAPEVSSYICESEAFQKSGGQLWIMPAGLISSDYPQRLMSIHWKDLYERNDGYLLIENLKHQWEELLQPDYVLIDSRTGHSEVMGICTRQLPDAVCAVFVPNPQNIDGLREVVEGIRRQERNSEGSQIRLHFVSSNIPYDDDERGTLTNALEKYREALGAKNIIPIHHDRHLALLGQENFVLKYPNANLSRDYRRLTDALRFDNLEDRTSALRYVRETLRTASGPDEANSIESRLQIIIEKHSDDPEVVLWLARLRRQLGAATDAAVLLDQTIATGRALGSAYIERASLRLQEQGDDRFALARAEFTEAIARLKPSDYRETLVAVRSLAALGDVDWREVAKHDSIRLLPAKAQLSLVKGLDTSDEEAEATRCILTLLKHDELSKDDIELWRLQLTLAQIRLGEFRHAIELLKAPEANTGTTHQSNAFNLAVALWGLTGQPDPSLFERVLALHDSARHDANYHQCLAISAFVCGRTDEGASFQRLAFEDIRSTSAMVFSAWRYLRISPVDFVQDLAELSTSITSGIVSMPVLSGRFSHAQQ